MKSTRRRRASSASSRTAQAIQAQLAPLVGGAAATVVRYALRKAHMRPRDLDDPTNDARFAVELERAVARFASVNSVPEELREQVTKAMAAARPNNTARPTAAPVKLLITTERDVALAQQAARRLAKTLGFPPVREVGIATAVSELARNIHAYAGGGEIMMSACQGERVGFHVDARDDGPGIANLDLVLSGDYSSKTGLGLGLMGVRSLMDEFEIETAPGKGTQVRASKYL